MRRVGGFGYNRFGCAAPRGAAAAFTPGPLRALDAASTYTIAIDAAGDAFGWGRSFHGCLPAVAGGETSGGQEGGGQPPPQGSPRQAFRVVKDTVMMSPLENENSSAA